MNRNLQTVVEVQEQGEERKKIFIYPKDNNRGKGEKNHRGKGKDT